MTVALPDRARRIDPALWSRVADLPVHLAVAATTAVAATGTLVTLGRQPLSWDEAVTLGAARRSPGHLWELLGHTDAPLGLYYAVMHGWLVLGDLVGPGAAAWWLRLPSALAAIGAVGLLTGLMTRWFGPAAGLLSGGLLAVHPMLTFYAQDARPYTLVTLAFLLATVALLRALESPTWQRFSVYGVAVVGCLYLHLFAGYALAAHPVLLLRPTRLRRREIGRLAAVLAGVAIVVAPLVLVARQQTGEVAWIAQPTPGLVVAVLTRMAGGGWLVLTLSAVAVAAAAAGRTGWRPDRQVAFLAAWLFLPVLALVLVDFVVPDLVARYGLVAVPAAAALVGWAAARRGRAAAVLAVVAVVVAATTTWHQESRPYKYEDYRAAADAMGDLARPGDAVMFFPMSMRAGFDAYRSLEPDLGNLRDDALASGGAPDHTDQITGIDVPPTAIAGRFRPARTIFVLGTAVGDLAHRPLSRIDRAQVEVLTKYHVVRTIRWGVVTLTELRRAP